jgi:hypothetical protein
MFWKTEKEKAQKKRCSHLQVMACDLCIVGLNDFDDFVLLANFFSLFGGRINQSEGQVFARLSKGPF